MGGPAIVSLSGGKDSTAMLLMMMERGEPIHSVAFFDTGWEFPELLAHVSRVRVMVQRAGIPFVVLRSRLPFNHWLYERQIVARKGKNKGRVHRIGNGWPSASRRWCTRQKADSLDSFARSTGWLPVCIGYGSDEAHRVDRANMVLRMATGTVRFPLMEWGITEAEALAYCRAKGFDWGGLYGLFDRVSCYCCPLQGVGDLRKVRRHRPAIWARMLEMDGMIQGNRGFGKDATLHDYEARFAEEDRQLGLWTKGAA